MIDEQHPMQIGLFPLDIKCHTPQQLQLQLQQQQQQQQQQQATTMLMGGNERMLTTSTTAVTMAATTNGSVNGTPTTTMPTTGAAASTAPLAPNEALCGGKAVGNEGSGSGNTTTTTTTTTTSTNVNGSCSNHKPNNNISNNNNSNNNGHDISNSNSKTLSTHQQQSHSDGPGPGPPPLPPPSQALCHAGRVTLGECNLNGIGADCVNGMGLGAPLSSNHNNNNCHTNCHMPHNSGMPLALQQHLQHQHQQQQQQQQQHQHQLHLHATHTASALLHGQHPATGTAMLCNHAPSGSASGAAVDPLSLQLSVPLPLTTLSCRGMSPAMAQCGYCCQPICDRYIMRVVDTSFHEGCLKCATCSLHLVHSCFARDGKLYCRIDYERLFIRNRCLGCGHKIASDELVMRTLENVFHLKCFACVVCGALLKKGEQYVVKQGQLFCRFDYEKEVEMLQGYDFYGDDLFPPKLDGRRGPKRPRTILNTQQRRAFKASFEVSPKPCRKVRENLAKETGLSLRIVQVWFQNQRAKVKKIQKKAKQEHSKGASDSQDSQESDNSSLAKIKDEAHSDNESLLESPYSSCGGAGGGGSGGGASASEADGVGKLRCIKDENENAPFNCMETNKENCNKTNEPILNTILGLSYATFQQLMGPFSQSPMANPIDRLYSMQNSYFRPDELSYGDCGKDMVEN